MAKFRVTQSDSSGFAWEITDLSKNWGAPSEYGWAALVTHPFVSGTSNVSSVYNYFPEGGYAYNFNVPFPIISSYPYSWTPYSEYNGQQFTFYPAIYETSTGSVWSVGQNNTIPLGSPAEGYTFTPQSNRPPLFYWTNNKTMGSAFNLLASEWNSFTQNINLVRQYKGLNNVSFSTAVKNYTVTASIYNEGYWAVNSMYSYMTSQGAMYMNAINSVAPKDIITANHLNNLQLALNTIT